MSKQQSSKEFKDAGSLKPVLTDNQSFIQNHLKSPTAADTTAADTMIINSTHMTDDVTNNTTLFKSVADTSTLQTS